MDKGERGWIKGKGDGEKRKVTGKGKATGKGEATENGEQRENGKRRGKGKGDRER